MFDHTDLDCETWVNLVYLVQSLLRTWILFFLNHANASNIRGLRAIITHIRSWGIPKIYNWFVFVFYDWDLILLNLQIKPQKVYINFFTNKNNHLASVGIKEKNSENQETKKYFWKKANYFFWFLIKDFEVSNHCEKRQIQNKHNFFG